MISNKYGFILIHPPKTGGTSVITALHGDTDEEFIIYPEENGDGIARVYPSTQDFPWWHVWVSAATAREDSTERHWPYSSTPWIQPVGAEEIFSNISPLSDVGKGNIKHMAYQWWITLLGDPRLQYYNSYKKYQLIATCRHPYTREFSLFLYLNQNTLKRLISTIPNLRKKDISAMIQDRWKNWVYTRLNVDRGSMAADKEGLFSQSAYLLMPQELVDEPWTQSGKAYLQESPVGLIRLEHINEDYNNICKELGISRRNEKLPHTLNVSRQWNEYVPNNILEWYTPEILKIVDRVRAEDFDILPYNKGNLE